MASTVVTNTSAAAIDVAPWYNNCERCNGNFAKEHDPKHDCLRCRNFSALDTFAQSFTREKLLLQKESDSKDSQTFQDRLTSQQAEVARHTSEKEINRKASQDAEVPLQKAERDELTAKRRKRESVNELDDYNSRKERDAKRLARRDAAKKDAAKKDTASDSNPGVPAWQNEAEYQRLVEELNKAEARLVAAQTALSAARAVEHAAESAKITSTQALEDAKKARENTCILLANTLYRNAQEQIRGFSASDLVDRARLAYTWIAHNFTYGEYLDTDPREPVRHPAHTLLRGVENCLAFSYLFRTLFNASLPQGVPKALEVGGNAKRKNQHAPVRPGLGDHSWSAFPLADGTMKLIDATWGLGAAFDVAGRVVYFPGWFCRTNEDLLRTHIPLQDTEQFLAKSSGAPNGFIAQDKLWPIDHVELANNAEYWGIDLASILPPAYSISRTPQPVTFEFRKVCSHFTGAFPVFWLSVDDAESVTQEASRIATFRLEGDKWTATVDLSSTRFPNAKYVHIIAVPSPNDTRLAAVEAEEKHNLVDGGALVIMATWKLG